ncbi:MULTISPECIES: glycosyltransferase family 9 protein [Pandoraea]|uniref:glycosyltransferase family 9 protein n=1 Tax=Pandoraea TaxID=93217 RepID=UPI001F5D1094|nr:MULTISPECIES: glycosyltransferase family 9 protein [Pandoraea]MCI3205542.1 heptosyltransferase [Pandoraea sp. LA3]MDN4583570.1 heptosyltransferase [Pandoraea capi]
MSQPQRRFASLIDPCTRIPYEWVYHEPDVFLQRTSKFSVAKKYLHRRLRLALSGQAGREVRHVAPQARVLWIYGGKASVGDAVMDMSGRALLRDREGPVDLLIGSGLKAVFDGDDIFRNVYDDPAAVDPANYDVVVLQEFNYPTLRIKRRFFAALPFACLFRFFHGPDRNQTQFSLAAVNDVFDLQLAPDELFARAKPYLREEMDLPQAIVNRLPSGPFIVLAMGGVEPRRTYTHWRECLDAYEVALAPGMPTGIVLLGSGNGADAARELMQTKFPHLELVSFVGELTLRDAKRVIANASLFVGADGGLMHVAHTTRAPSVTLFAAAEPPYLRLTPRCQSTPLQTQSDVSAVDPVELAQTIVATLAATSSRLPN